MLNETAFMSELDKFAGIDTGKLTILPAETSTAIEVYELQAKELVGLKVPYEKLVPCTIPAKRAEFLEKLKSYIAETKDYSGIIADSFEAGWPLYNRHSQLATYLQLNVLELKYKQMALEINAKFLSTNISLVKPDPKQFLAYIPEMHCYEQSVIEHAPPLAQIFEQLWPAAESAMLEHTIGRALAGADNTKPEGSTEYLNKGFRTICIALGSPGIGKSALIELIRSTMDFCLYKTATYFGFDSEFGKASMYAANLLSMDDSSSGELTSVATSPEAKAFATGAPYSANVKGKERIEGRCKAVMLGAGNEINEFDIKAGDAGNLDRLVFCKGKDSPGRVLDYIDECAEKANCSREVLMMASMRLALDKYIALPDNGRSSIEFKQAIEAEFCYRLDANRQITLVKAILLATVLSGLPIEPITRKTFIIGIIQLCKLTSLGYGTAAFEAKGKIRADYHSKGKPKNHAWSVFRDEISNDTLDAFIASGEQTIWENHAQGSGQSNATMSKILQSVTDSAGISFGAKIAPFKQAWTELYKNQAEIISLKELIAGDLLAEAAKELNSSVKARPANIQKWANK